MTFDNSKVFVKVTDRFDNKRKCSFQTKNGLTLLARGRGAGFASPPGIQRLWPGSTRGIFPPNPPRAGKACRSALMLKGAVSKADSPFSFSHLDPI